MDAASVVQLQRSSDFRARVLEISAQLRAAVVNGHDADITRLLGELVHFRGSSRAQSDALQLRALQSLVYLLRSAATNDELTGLLNRRGFLQCATRLLDLAVRDRCPHRLIYFRLSPRQDGAAFAPMALRQMGNALRDLFPDYGMREALGRLGGAEFAALTPRVEYLACDSILRHIATTAATLGPAGTRLDLGIARFDPQGPVEIDELLARCMEQALRSRELFRRTASFASGPPTRSDASLTVSGRRFASCKD
ncbi:MAG TPA: diguanylate cyclase [Steroidobacteraceae bacterium]|nr:diguanylate cyclase [Steroidobacteraceae bacterium]